MSELTRARSAERVDGWPITEGSVRSRDGTIISYRQLGVGPGVVVLHGAMQSARSHTGLAEALADAFTVYMPERRGHQLGVPFDETYGMRQEVEDLEALLVATGATRVFGVSAGGLICLQAALELPAIRKVAVYEPALAKGDDLDPAGFARCDAEIARGDLAAAMVTGMKVSRLGPPIFNLIPRPVLAFLTGKALASEDRAAKAADVTMRALAPTLHYDFSLVSEMAGSPQRFAALGADVLLLGGDRSPAWLKSALDGLEKLLPNADRVEFAGLAHGGSSDDGSTNRGGQPARVAQALRRFFSQG